MKTVKQWRFLQQQNNRIDIECDGRHQLHIFVLEQDIIRVMFKNKGELRLDKTWSIAPGQKRCTVGRPRQVFNRRLYLS